MSTPDVVYIVREGGDHDNLRYSLRSLDNIDHGRVWLAGHRPSWAVNVGHIPTSQTKSRFRNSTGNLLAACLHPDVSDLFTFFNDDYFALRPTVVPSWHRGRVNVTAHGDLVRLRRTPSYRDGMAATVWLLREWGVDDPLDYDLHVPMPVDRHKMAAVIEAALPAGIEALHKRTLYGNMIRLAADRHDDVKIGTAGDTWAAGQAWVSSSDQSWRGRLGAELRELFPDPSPYEEPVP